MFCRTRPRQLSHSFHVIPFFPHLLSLHSLPDLSLKYSLVMIKVQYIVAYLVLEKDLVYELIRDKDKVCENCIWCVFWENSNSLNKDSQRARFNGIPL